MRIATPSLLIIMCSCYFINVGLAGAREDGMMAFKRGEYERTLRFWSPLAEAGDREIQYNLGIMYSDGRGIEKSTPLALKWLNRAAQQDDTDALFRLGKLYAKDPEIQDFTIAESWIRKAALKGHGTACYYLAQLYAHGKGLNQDIDLALRWYYRGAENNNVSSMYNLGVMHEHGQGIPKNLPEAFRWYDKAAKQGAADAQANLGRLYFSGHGVAKDKVMAYVWFTLAEQQKNKNAMKNARFTFSQLSQGEQEKALSLSQEYKVQFIN